MNTQQTEPRETCVVAITVHVRYFYGQGRPDRTQTIPVRDVHKAITEAPKGANGFLFYDVAAIGSISNIMNNVSGNYFIDGQVQDGSTVVKCRDGNWCSFDPVNDAIVSIY